jgi:hypothetical protein
VVEVVALEVQILPVDREVEVLAKPMLLEITVVPIQAAVGAVEDLTGLLLDITVVLEALA